MTRRSTTSLRSRDRYLRRKYGITLAEYERIYNYQKGMCAVCGRCVPLVVDHDHRTGIVRGLLCRITCNYRLLGRGLDNAELHS
ncbi:MAG: endonuclease VII domain-containing protein, partial [Nitrososphaera sp.]|nr:endonuclease VII domain-containing protein [Nitrososphaera sp.]